MDRPRVGGVRLPNSPNSPTTKLMVVYIVVVFVVVFLVVVILIIIITLIMIRIIIIHIVQNPGDKTNKR